MTQNTYLVTKFFKPCYALTFFLKIQRLSSFLLILGLFSLGLQAQNSPAEKERIIVKFKEETSFLSRMFTLDRYKSKLYKKHLTSGYHILIPEDYAQTSVDQLLEELRRDHSVEWAEKDLVYESLMLPNDTEFSKQWGLANDGGKADINVKEAWEITQGSDETVVAVIDGGIDWTHPDLVANIWQNSGEDLDGDGVLVYIDGRWQFDPDDMNGVDDDNNGYPDDFIGWDFINHDNNPYDDTYYGHGTHVAGIIGAQGNNGQGVAGVSWTTKLMPLKFLDRESRGYVSDAVEALDYAVEMGAKISNNSWGGYGFTQALQDAVERAGDAGHLLIAAAGNDGQNNDYNPLYPASLDFDNVLSVAASDENDQLADFSNFGFNTVDIAAPGVNIYSTLPQGKYGYSSGTSMAAPFVSGSAALLWAINSSSSMQEVKESILSNIDQPEDLIGKMTSSGRLNIGKALQEEGNTDCKVKARFKIKEHILCLESSVNIRFKAQTGNKNSFKWFVNGQLVATSKSFTYTFSEDGLYAIRLVVADNDCERELTQYISVIGRQELNLQDISVCRSAVMLETDVLAANYIWKNEAGQVIGNTAKVSVTESGTYTLRVMDGCGRIEEERVNVALQGDCVWPGDVNVDGVVNHLDILNWGMAYGATGPRRSSLSTDYAAQPTSADWSGFFPENHLGKTVNYKHADCNGDGVVDRNDAEVIRQNAENACISQLDLALANNVSLEISSDQESLSWGDQFNFDISLNVDNGELRDVYGVAFTIEYSLPFTQGAELNFSDSWLGTINENMEGFAFEGQNATCTRLAFVRTDQNSISTSGGVLGQRRVIIAIDDIDTYAILNQEADLAIKISEAILFKGDGSMLTIQNFGAQNTKYIKILPKETKEDILTNIYPNPTNGAFSLEIITPESSQNKVLVTNLLGKTVYAHNCNLTKGQNVLQFSLPNLSKGVYLLHIVNKENQKTTPKRLIIK